MGRDAPKDARELRLAQTHPEGYVGPQSAGRQEAGPRPSVGRPRPTGAPKRSRYAGWCVETAGRRPRSRPVHRPSSEEGDVRTFGGRTRCEGNPAEAEVPPGIADGYEPRRSDPKTRTATELQPGMASRSELRARISEEIRPERHPGVGGPVAEATRSDGDPSVPREPEDRRSRSTWLLPDGTNTTAEPRIAPKSETVSSAIAVPHRSLPGDRRYPTSGNRRRRSSRSDGVRRQRQLCSASHRTSRKRTTRLGYAASRDRSVTTHRHERCYLVPQRPSHTRRNGRARDKQPKRTGSSSPGSRCQRTEKYSDTRNLVGGDPRTSREPPCEIRRERSRSPPEGGERHRPTPPEGEGTPGTVQCFEKQRDRMLPKRCSQQVGEARLQGVTPLENPYPGAAG